MDLKQLRLLCALADSGHFKQAAEACFVSQPSLSMRLKALEAELGVSLVRRNQRFEGFTPEGERLLQYARQVIATCDAIKLEAEALQGKMVGTVRLGVVPLSDFSPAREIAELNRRHPELRFEVRALSNEDILQQLEHNKLDLGIVYQQPVNQRRYFLTPLGANRCHLLHHPRQLPLDRVKRSACGGIHWRALVKLPLALLTPNNFFRQFVDRQLVAAGLSVAPVVATDSVHQLLQSVSAGHCATIIPSDTLAGIECGSLASLPIVPATPGPSLGVIMKRTEPAPIVPSLVFEHLTGRGQAG